jgi:hypothetical protein
MRQVDAAEDDEVCAHSRARRRLQDSREPRAQPAIQPRPPASRVTRVPEEVQPEVPNSRYGLTQASFDLLLEAQQNACGMCRKPFEERQLIHVDHDHACCRAKTNHAASASVGSCAIPATSRSVTSKADTESLARISTGRAGGRWRDARGTARLLNVGPGPSRQYSPLLATCLRFSRALLLSSPRTISTPRTVHSRTRHVVPSCISISVIAGTGDLVQLSRAGESTIARFIDERAAWVRLKEDRSAVHLLCQMDSAESAETLVMRAGHGRSRDNQPKDPLALLKDFAAKVRIELDIRGQAWTFTFGPESTQETVAPTATAPHTQEIWAFQISDLLSRRYGFPPAFARSEAAMPASPMPRPAPARRDRSDATRSRCGAP